VSIAADRAPPAPGDAPTFPPLLRGHAVPRGIDPFHKAMAAAAAGEDPGAVFYNDDPAILHVAVIFAPETTLDRALAMVFAAGAGLNDALGALAPPEVGVEHVWPDGVKVNGAWCGALRAASDATAPDAAPDWLVVGVSLSLRFPQGVDPGAAPDITALSEEGCGDIPPVRLIESWSRHMLTWIHRWEVDGPRPLFDAWLDRAEGRGRDVVFAHDGATHRGKFLGLSDTGDMLLLTPDGPVSLPLAAILSAPRAWPPEGAQ
jgi:biotin-(acetyl-CoA carboxylase) ligase